MCASLHVVHSAVHLGLETQEKLMFASQSLAILIHSHIFATSFGCMHTSIYCHHSSHYCLLLQALNFLSSRSSCWRAWTCTYAKARCKTPDTDFDCALLPVDNTCRQWLREYRYTSSHKYFPGGKNCYCSKPVNIHSQTRTSTHWEEWRLSRSPRDKHQVSFRCWHDHLLK